MDEWFLTLPDIGIFIYFNDDVWPSTRGPKDGGIKSYKMGELGPQERWHPMGRKHRFRKAIP
jgi:hypothetical protein